MSAIGPPLLLSLIFIFGLGTACGQTRSRAEKNEQEKPPKFEVTVSEAATGKKAERLLKEAEQRGKIRSQYTEESDKCRRLIRESKLSEAETVCKAAIQLADQMEAPNELERIGARESVGEALVGQKRYREALDYYSRALELGQHSDLTETDAELGRLYGNLAMTNHLLGDLDKAREMYRKTEQIYQAAYANFGKDNDDEWTAGIRRGYLKYLKMILGYHRDAAEEVGAASEIEEIEKLLKSLP